MSLPKIQPCPRCLDGGDPTVMIYDNGWRHVECLDCDLLGPGAGSQKAAVQLWNAKVARPLPQPTTNSEDV